MDNVVRWCRVCAGRVVSPAGPLPYVWELPGGGTIMLHGLTETQLRRYGWRKVERRGCRSYDEDIERMETPEVVVENGKPIEVYSYSFAPGARRVMLEKIDTQAEKRRAPFVSAHAGQGVEYERAYQEAVLALAEIGAGRTLENGAFPYLEADVGVTKNPTTGKPVESLEEAARLIISARSSAERSLTQIRSRRLAAKAAIKAAATDAEAYEIYLKAWDGKRLGVSVAG